MEDEKIIGSGSIRLNPEIHEYTEKICGHLFYQIIPSKRGNGYGTILCHLLLEKMKELKLLIDESNTKKEDVDNLNIDAIEEKYAEYKTITNEKIDETDYQKQEQLYEITKDLYESYIILNTYINNNGYKTIHNFGMDLYKAIILDTANFSGNETNVVAIIEQYQGSGSETLNRTTYTSDSGYQAYLDINPKSKLYSLIGKVSEYQEYSDIKDFHIVLKYDEKTIKEIEETLDFYKECIYTDYEIKDKSFLFFKNPEEIISKKTKVPTK